MASEIDWKTFDGTTTQIPPLSYMPSQSAVMPTTQGHITIKGLRQTVISSMFRSMRSLAISSIFIAMRSFISRDLRSSNASRQEHDLSDSSSSSSSLDFDDLWSSDLDERRDTTCRSPFLASPGGLEIPISCSTIIQQQHRS